MKTNLLNRSMVSFVSGMTFRCQKRRASSFTPGACYDGSCSGDCWGGCRGDASGGRYM